MKYKELLLDNNSYVKESKINDILISKKFYWIIDSEFENAVIEIKKDTLIWHSGSYFSGNWHYGIFKGGDFFGTWENGIWENGKFEGKWKSGIK
jgi:hypothetical protein